MDDQPPSFFIGHHDPKRPLPVTPEAVQDVHAANYDMVTSPITTPHFHSRVLALLSASFSSGSDADITQTGNASPIVVAALSPADTPLTPDETTSQIIATASSWVDLASPDPVIADISRQVLKLELSYAAFCGITYVLIPGPRSHNQVETGGIVQYARAILDGLAQGPYMQLYIWLSMIDSSEGQANRIGDLAPFAREHHQDNVPSANGVDVFGTWAAWDTIRSVCKYSPRLYIALSLPRLLPPPPIQSRWYSEPVRLMTLDVTIFAKNQKGYPALSKAHQILMSRFVRLRNPPWFLLCNVGPVPASSAPTTMNGDTIMNMSAFPTIAETASHTKDPTLHLSYLRNLQSKQPPLTLLDKFGSGYQDFLQAPLQPLTVNLESVTYEVFEKDPVKYDWYERAISEALTDWKSQRKPTSNPDGRVVVAVVGAGRGPLVSRVLKAAEATGVGIDMWALEKNPNAFVLLQRHNQSQWYGRVNLVKSDMRTWRGPVRQANADRMSKIYTDTVEAHQQNTNPISPSATFTGSPVIDSTYLLATANKESNHYKIDILISELLGSFADNELSPECLDGVQHLLNPVHGISIPTNYTAFITPICAPKLYSDINNSMIQTTPTAAETPYVVMLNAIDFISTTTTPTTTSTSSPKPATQNQPQSPLSSYPPNDNPTSRSSTIPSAPTAKILPTWSFTHPNPALPAPSATPTNTHNARHTTLTFPCPNRSTIHGLAGYFESLLYRPSTSSAAAIELSTNPLTMERKSPEMISWFPIYFPLKQAVFVPDQGEVVVDMWRRTDERKVWYEWKIDVFVLVGGEGERGGRRKRVRVGGSEVHSSEREACLM